MALFRRRRAPTLPDDVLALLEVGPGAGPGERVLAWSALTGNGYAIATAVGLRVVTPRGTVVRRPWTDVHHAAWDDDSQTLAVWWVGSRQTTPLEPTDPARLAAIVHQRVDASVVMAAEVPVPGGRRVWVALRKGADGTLLTQAVPPPGVKVDDPAVAAVLEKAVRSLRDQAGLEDGRVS